MHSLFIKGHINTRGGDTQSIWIILLLLDQTRPFQEQDHATALIHWTGKIQLQTELTKPKVLL